MPARRRNNRQQVVIPPIGALTQGSAFLCMSWQFPDQAGAQPTGYSLAWTAAGVTTTVPLGATVRRYDINALSGVLPAPVAAVATLATGGTIPAGTSAYRVSAMNSAGQETLASAEVTVATTGTTSSNTITWPLVPGASYYRVFGRTVGGELLLALLGANVGSYVDSGAVTPAGALPTANTTGPATPTVALGASVSCTVTATYAGGATCPITKTATMVALAQPSYLNSGPRTTLTANNFTGNMNGYNQSPGADGIVRYTGVNFTQSFYASGTGGGPNVIKGYVFTDCQFPSINTQFDLTGAAGAVYDHCFSGEISNVAGTVSGGSATRTVWNGVVASPIQLFRYDSVGNAGSALTTTPWLFADCLFHCTYPVPENGNHFEAVHIRGAKDVTILRCTLDVGFGLNRDGSAPAVTANWFVELGYGGNDNIVVDSCWCFGPGPYYAVVLEGTRLVMKDCRWGQSSVPGDTQFEGQSRKAPAINITAGPQGSASLPQITFLRNVWAIDGTPMGTGRVADFDNSQKAITWT